MEGLLPQAAAEERSRRSLHNYGAVILEHVTAGDITRAATATEGVTPQRFLNQYHKLKNNQVDPTGDVKAHTWLLTTTLVTGSAIQLEFVDGPQGDWDVEELVMPLLGFTEADGLELERSYTHAGSAVPLGVRPVYLRQRIERSIEELTSPDFNENGRGFGLIRMCGLALEKTPRLSLVA